MDDRVTEVISVSTSATRTFSSHDWVHPATDSTRFEGVRLALRERGYIEGQNIATEYRYLEGKRKRVLNRGAGGHKVIITDCTDSR